MCGYGEKGRVRVRSLEKQVPRGKAAVFSDSGVYMITALTPTNGHLVVTLHSHRKPNSCKPTFHLILARVDSSFLSRLIVM